MNRVDPKRRPSGKFAQRSRLFRAERLTAAVFETMERRVLLSVAGCASPAHDPADAGTVYPADVFPTLLTSDSAPRIDTSTDVDFAAGQIGTVTFTATGSPSATFVEIGTLLTGSGLTLAQSGTLTGDPTLGVGNFPLTIEAENVVGSSAHVFTLTVDQPPTFTSDASTTFTAGTFGSFGIAVSAVPAASISLKPGEALPSGLSLVKTGDDTAALEGVGAVGTGGTYALTFDAKNGVSPMGTQAFTLTIDQSPKIYTGTDVDFATGQTGTVTFTATAFPAATFVEIGSLLTGSGLTLAQSGALTGEPTLGLGHYPLTIEAENTLGSATHVFTLTVDQAPTFTSEASITFTTGTFGSFGIAVSAVPAASITLKSGQALPSGLSLVKTGNNTAALEGVPAARTGGTYALTFDARNGVSPMGTQAFALTIDESPKIDTGTDVDFATSQAGTVTFTATGFPLATFAEIGTLLTGSGLTLAQSGALTGDPTIGLGQYPLTIDAVNTVGISLHVFTLTVDQAPAITSASSTTFTTGTLGSFGISTTGDPAATVTFKNGTTHLGELSLMKTGDNTTALEGNVTPGFGGTYVFTLVAKNGVSPQATQVFTLTVDDAPKIDTRTKVDFSVGRTGTVTFTSTGFPAATFVEIGSLLTGSGLTLAQSGTLTGDPTLGVGTYPLTVDAVNTLGTSFHVFTLTVDQIPSFTSGASATFTAGTFGSFGLAVSAAPPASISLEAGQTLPGGLSLVKTGNNTAALEGVAVAGTGGTYALTFDAKNGVSPKATQVFTLTVDESPKLDSKTDVEFTAGQTGTVTFTSTGFPAATFEALGSLLTGSGLTLNNGTGALTGEPTLAVGTYALTLESLNTVGSSSYVFTLTVDQTPSFNNDASTTFTADAFGSFGIAVTAAPVATIFLESGQKLPDGLSLVQTGNDTAALEGVVAAGTYTFTLEAKNGVNPAGTQAFTLTVT